jgi:hypothetical protein
MQRVIYRRRRDALSRSERAWRVDDDALVSVGSSGAEKRYRWADIENVRLRAEPRRARPWRYVFELQPRQGGKLVIDNAHYVAPTRYEERSDTYRAFVGASLERLAAAKPEMKALIGETPKRYFFLLITALLTLGVLSYVLIAVRTPLDNLPYAMAVKFGIVLLMLPVFWRWVLGAMPRGVPLADIPERALPPG